ncbi:MAG: hypothetical protein FRX49_07056 [Trebouxia sp. A1-2]|nr:MAG: hypothetical protein FRX49_07056 [Trebouxia sp. A1-2]
MDQFELPNAPMYMYLQLLTAKPAGDRYSDRTQCLCSTSQPRDVIDFSGTLLDSVEGLNQPGQQHNVVQL